MIGEHLLDWLNLGVRWLHVIAGIVWIGTSFYFVWLNNHVRPEPGSDSDAELWAVHGGAFYQVAKYEKLRALPETLHWFKWEAYTTWMSGFSLLILVFYIDSPALLTGSRGDLALWEAAAIGVGFLVLGWIIYEFMSRSPLLERPLWFGVVALVLLIGGGILLSQVFSTRAAYIHVGAVMGTLMAGNVFFVIIPAQREMVSAMEEGREPEVAIGRHAALRSLHNNYLTLPVVFIMLSGHFPFTFGDDRAWAVLAGLIVVSAAIRHWFNLRAKGVENVWLMPAAALGMLALAFVTLPTSDLPDVDPATITFDAGVAIVETRCTPCHSENPSQPGFTQPPKGVVLDTPEQMIALADMIRQQAIDSDVMPLGNLTSMTDEERAMLEAWLDEHAG